MRDRIPDDEVVVVSGVPRSGTSMAMQMLAAGGIPVLADRRRPADADNPRGYYELEAVKSTARDASWVEKAGGRAVKVVHSLLTHLPASGLVYRVVFLHRVFDEILASQRAMLERLGRPGGTLPEAQLVAIFERQVAEAIDVARRPPFRLLELRYSEVVAEPRVAAEAIRDHVDVELNAEAMAAAVRPELWRQKKR